MPIVNDLLDESDETFLVNLTAPQNATILDGQALGTITDNDPFPTLAVDDVTVLEGDSGTVDATFTVRLNVPSGREVTVNYATANGSAVAPGDYAPASGPLAFAPGETTKSVTVTVNGDLLDEANETFFVNLTSPTNATFLDNQGLGTITDDDGTPALSINDATVTEGNSGSINAIFTVTLAPTSGQTVTVQYATADGTAVASSDYTQVGNTLTFAPGESTKTIAVQVRGDTAIESNETFLVNLSNATNAALADGQGLGTITNDDAAAAPPPPTAATTSTPAAATTPAGASDDRSQAVRAGQGRAAEVGTDAQVASSGACSSLQRPALPQRAQDLHRLADEAAAEAQGALEVPGAHLPAEARHLHVDRLAERGWAVREDARAEQLQDCQVKAATPAVRPLATRCWYAAERSSRPSAGFDMKPVSTSTTGTFAQLNPVRSLRRTSPRSRAPVEPTSAFWIDRAARRLGP